MKKQVLKYTIRTHKKDNNLIEIFVRDYPSYTRPFTTFSVNWGHNEACEGYYINQTRPANEKEIDSIKETTLKTFVGLYGDDYELQYLKRLPR